MLRKASDQHIHHKNKQAKAIFHFFFFFFFINQTTLVNIYVENAANLQSAAGLVFWWLATSYPDSQDI